MSATADKPIYVPIALPLDVALAVFGATRFIFDDATRLGLAAQPEAAALAQGMVLLAEAIDKARGTEGRES